MKNIYKVPKDIKRAVETELYHFEQNKKLLKELEEEIIEETPEIQENFHSNSISKPTEIKALKLMSTRRIIECSRRINYINKALRRLNEEELKIFDCIFVKGYNQMQAQNKEFISKDTYYNTYRKIIFFVAQEFGYF